MRPADLPGAPFDVVLDVGGNVGTFAAACVDAWPGCRVTSFEPMPWAVRMSRARADGRWTVVEGACSNAAGRRELLVCVNQHSASTLERPGPVRAERFGIVDTFEPIEVETLRLADAIGRRELAGRRVLLKVDVEGHELEALLGAGELLELVALAVVECNVAPVFDGQPTPAVIDRLLRQHGLGFAGVVDCLLDPEGELVQFDGAWSRAGVSLELELGRIPPRYG